MRSLLLPAILLCLPAWAGQITLKNGDRLSGAVVKSDEKSLVFKSELAGTVTVAWDSVVAISSSDPLHVGLRDGQVVVGPVETAGQKLEIATKDAGKVVAPKEAVRFLRSKEEQAAYDAQSSAIATPDSPICGPGSSTSAWRWLKGTPRPRTSTSAPTPTAPPAGTRSR